MQPNHQWTGNGAAGNLSFKQQHPDAKRSCESGFLNNSSFEYDIRDGWNLLNAHLFSYGSLDRHLQQFSNFNVDLNIYLHDYLQSIDFDFDFI